MNIHANKFPSAGKVSSARIRASLAKSKFFNWQMDGAAAIRNAETLALSGRHNLFNSRRKTAIRRFTLALECLDGLPKGNKKAAKLRENAFLYRGAAKYELSDYKGAIADFDKVLMLNRANIFALRNRAHAKHHTDDVEGAIDDYTSEAQIFIKKGRVNEAKNLIDRIARMRKIHS